jgi:hypothetical protein
LAVIVIVVSLLLAEAMVRLVAPRQLVAGRPDVYAPRDSLGWVFRPALETAINTGERTVTLRTDSAGLRVGEAGRTEGAPRVLLIGDSFLAALQVEYEQSIAGLLADRLRLASGTPVTIRNAGVPGWDPPQYLVRARQLLATEPYDAMVVFVYLGNDVVADPRPYIQALEPTPVRRLRLPARVTPDEFIDAWFRPANDALERHSHLFVLLKERLRPVLMRAGLTADYFPVEFMRREAASGRWDTTATLLTALAATAAAHDVPTLFVLLPTPWQMDPRVFAEYLAGFGIDSGSVDLDQPNRLLGDRLAARSLDAIDLLLPLRERSAAGAALFGRVDRHLSPEGNQVIAELLGPEIARRLVARRRGSAGI